MGRELEFKFRATPELQEQIRRRFGEFSTISMETVYYDTPEALLDSLCITLRRRLENGVSVCTLKSPAPDGARGEWEREAARIEDCLEPLCREAGLEALYPSLAGRLAPSCGARFTRRAARVEFAGAQLELALDRGALLGGGREQPLCEVEAELKSGPDEAARRFAALLAAEFALVPEPLSKVQRARALAKEGGHGL